MSWRVVRFAQLEVDQLRSVAFVASALQFGRTTYVGAVPGDASRTQHSYLWPPYVIGGTIIFLPCSFFLLLLLLSSFLFLA